MATDVNKVFLGFLGHIVTEDREYLGGLLVTTLEGVPKEFKHTEPVRPSRLQTVIYGESLEPCLGSDAIAETLYSQMAVKPTAICVDETGQPLFGRFVANNPPGALLLRFSSTEHAFGQFLAPDGNLLEGVELQSRAPSGGHLYAYVEDDSTGAGRRTLELASQRMNLESAFDRVRQVLHEIAQIDKTPSR